MPRPRVPASPFRYFKTSPEVIRRAVMMYVKFPLSVRILEDLLAERGIDVSYDTVRYWLNRFGLFAADIRRQRVSHMRGFRQWRWHLDEMYVKSVMIDFRKAKVREGKPVELRLLYKTRTSSRIGLG